MSRAVTPGPDGSSERSGHRAIESALYVVPVQHDGVPGRPAGLRAGPDAALVSAGFVARPRLDAVLDDATSRRLTVVVAPAGAGKTSTLAHWASASRQRVRWINPVMATAAEALADLAAALGATAGPATSAPELVILDDAHRLPVDAWPLLDGWLRRQPPDGVRVVLASRRDVPLGLATLELTDAVTVLRAGSLRFTDPEARALVALHAPGAADDDAAALQDLAQGWAAALVLGAHTLVVPRDGAPADDVPSRAQQPVLDYLLAEVFLTLPAATRHVLTCTADSEEVSEAEAVLLAGDPAAPQRLADLAADGLLVSAHRDQEGELRWRLHPLLHETLRRQVALYGPDHAVALAAHQRAALHYAAHGPAREAVRHAAAAGAYPLLASLLIDEGLSLVVAGEESLVVSAVHAMPPRTISEQPALLGVTAMANRGIGDVETAARLASQATRHASRVWAELTEGAAAGAQPTGDDMALLTDAAMLEAWQARFGWTDVATAIVHARELLGCHHGDETFTSRATAPHAPHRPRWSLPSSRIPWLLNELATAELWTGQLALAETHTGEALVAAGALGQHRVTAGTYANRALIEMIYGRLQDASAAAGASIAASVRSGRTEDSLLARAHLVHAYVAYSHLRLSSAVEALERVRRISERASDPLVAALADHLSSRLLAESGDLEAARAVQAGPAVPDELPAYLVWLFALVQAQWAVRAGDTFEVQRLARLMLNNGWPEGHALMLAILTDLDGNPASAARQLDLLLAETPQHTGMLTSAIASVYRLRMVLRDGSPGNVHAALHDMLGRVGPTQLYSTLVFPGPDPALARRLRREAASARPHPYASRAAAALDRYAQHCSLAGSGNGPEREGSLNALTARESDVLNELALGGSYTDVAHALYVSENTVKTHIARLYRKLGAERRADALRTARERGLL